MNRVIKFRAWDRGLQEWVDWPLELNKGVLEFNDSRMAICQFTGLKDKNGKEIFEGDIVGREGVYHFIERKPKESWQPRPGNWKIIGEKSENFTGKGEEKYIAGYELEVVEWKESSCGFEPFSDSEDNCGHCGGGGNPRSMEVIGNIYENPELVK